MIIHYHRAATRGREPCRIGINLWIIHYIDVEIQTLHHVYSAMPSAAAGFPERVLCHKAGDPGVIEAGIEVIKINLAIEEIPRKHEVVRDFRRLFQDISPCVVVVRRQNSPVRADQLSYIVVPVVEIVRRVSKPGSPRD